MRKGIEKCFAAAAPGLEEVCAAELRSLNLAEVLPVPGGAEFEADLRDIYRANLWLRSAGRVLVRIGEFRSRDLPDLFRKSVRLPWGKFVKSNAPVRVKVSSRASRLVHGEKIAATLSAAVDRALGREAPSPSEEGQLILVRFEEDRCTLSVDTSGELLHRRGYRTAATRAPLRETLAAGILLRLGWDGSKPLFDPMCGSGTFLIEAALLALQVPPGQNRSFAFMNWPGYRPGLWQALLVEAGREEPKEAPLLRGGDRDESAIAAARENAARAGVLPRLALERRQLSQTTGIAGEGLVICNPPYGERLDGGRDLRPLYAALGRVCRESFPGWRWALLCPDASLARAAGLEVEKIIDLSNGGLRVGLYASR